ncbi:hypothetical protein A1O3_05913 [Capronia epimyces CBS 606.96]|uniref:Zn(2)-C6 fungal-type domain-containing protein n=1 Tax=Capronia epimyces CBS 606.96 TaxID=1182542 RepID=W9XYA1_9EURO|nr:uncharacterized protein A1O3_05913 [Capronia epimyces CBS 606.96]EXJ85238.1 hypothetical protein A1O3_05913 [Capronia epimyces CBS 606.96]
MDPSTPRRPITSCLECYRRKQKCNRSRPCNHCRARKVPEKCCYLSSDTPWPNTPPAHADLVAPVPVHELEDGSNVDEDTPLPPSLVDRAGYSSTPGSSTFVRLESENLDSDLRPPSLSIESSSIPHQGRRRAYLRLVARLPPPDIVHALLEFLFLDVYWTIMVIDEHQVKNSYLQWLAVPVEEHLRARPGERQREMLYFPALLFQVLAQILHHISPSHPAVKTMGLNDNAECLHLSRTFYLIGCKLISILGRHHPTLCSVEHDLISCSWLKDSSRGAEAWRRLGSAVSQAQELGLHRLPQNITQTPDDSLESKLLKTWDLEHRKHIWARLFILSSTLALALGRPRLLHREDFSTPAPLNCEYPENPSRTLPLANDTSRITTMMIFLALAHKIHDILSFSANGVFLKDYSKVLAVHNDIYALREEFPLLLQHQPLQSNPASTAAQTRKLEVLRSGILNATNAVLMALHRPYIASQATSRRAAITAALEGLNLQQADFDPTSHTYSKQYGTIFYTIEASIFLCGIMIGLPSPDPGEDSHIEQAILQGIGRLAAIKDNSPLAESGEQMLRQFYHKIQNARQQPPTDFVMENDGPLSHLPIPSPQRPAYETYHSFFGGGEGTFASFDLPQDPNLALEDPSLGDWGDLLEQDDFVWPPYRDIG